MKQGLAVTAFRVSVVVGLALVLGACQPRMHRAVSYQPIDYGRMQEHDGRDYVYGGQERRRMARRQRRAAAQIGAVVGYLGPEIIACLCAAGHSFVNRHGPPVHHSIRHGYRRRW